MTIAVVSRVLTSCAYTPRKKVTACLLILIGIVLTIAVLGTVNSRLAREDKMELKIVNMQAKIDFLQSMYNTKYEIILKFQDSLREGRTNFKVVDSTRAPLSTAAAELLKNISGTIAATGIHTTRNAELRTPFIYQLLPHLMNDPDSLTPAYHMKGPMEYADVVIGIPTVKRDKESYLMITLTHLIQGLNENDLKKTIIVVFVGETDMQFVLNTARQIETLFPQHVKSGLIEVISPAASYYPDLNAMTPNLGDSAKRFRWRTKQNLDTMYLMSYARTKGMFYLMLEDDTICKKSYMKEIRDFEQAVSATNSGWFFIEFCPIGGIGKLFRSKDLHRFITYVQLFYNNLPIDWLLESYLADRVCTIEKSSKTCRESKLSLRPRYSYSLFQHIGLYSSLKGKIQKIKDPHFGSAPTFFPRQNPPLRDLKTDIESYNDHTIQRAYNGHTFFWGHKPKKNDVIEFWFEEPISVERYTFRSGNVEHVSDRFNKASVEILPVGQSNFTEIGNFDEFGIAEKQLDKDVGPLTAIRLKVKEDHTFWIILSEIEIKPVESTTATR